MSDDPIARAALGMAAALRERCPGCKAGRPRHTVMLAGRVAAVHDLGDPESECRLYDDERLALASYEKAAKS